MKPIKMSKVSLRQWHQRRDRGQFCCRRSFSLLPPLLSFYLLVLNYQEAHSSYYQIRNDDEVIVRFEEKTWMIVGCEHDAEAERSLQIWNGCLGRGINRVVRLLLVDVW